jgi:hypothetical protein
LDPVTVPEADTLVGVIAPSDSEIVPEDVIGEPLTPIPSDPLTATLVTVPPDPVAVSVPLV